MVEYVTRDQLRNFGKQVGVTEGLRLRKSTSSYSQQGSTFLSHSSKDEDLVTGAIVVLKNHGASVYVDEIDPEMPPYTSEKTAALLKGRIHDAGRFILLASKNSRDSRWVPWELGVADGIKTPSKIALFPASEAYQDKSWASWEYLGLYDRIVFGNHQNYAQPIWMVIDEKRNTATELRAWITGS